MDYPVDNDSSLSIKDIIKEAAKILSDAALDLIEKDPHQYSKRPCDTCRTISNLIGRPFGCEKINH